MVRITWIILIVGILIRIAAFNQSPVDAMTIRQCQTADAIASMHTQGGFPLSAEVSWHGDTSPRLAQEFPVYHWLVLLPMKVGLSLEPSAKMVSILLWVLSFLCLQYLWRRGLNDLQILVANLFFTLAPLSCFFSQAIMVESLMMALSVAFILCVVRYAEKSTLLRLLPCWLIGTLAMLIKPPTFLHLIIVAAAIVIWQQGWRKALKRPEFYLASLLSTLAILAWAFYCSRINADFGNWSPGSNLRGFIGTLSERLEPRFYIKIGSYIIAFLLSPFGLILVLGGFWQILRLKLWLNSGSKALLLWLCSLFLFYCIWGVHGPSNHSYYNLPSLIPLSWLATWGATFLLEKTEKFLPLWRNLFLTLCAVVLIVPTLGATRYLFQKDPVLLEVSAWIKEYSQPEDLVLIIPNHRQDMIDYPENPCFTYLSSRRGWVWTKNLPLSQREKALSRASHIVVTLPTIEDQGFWKLLARKIKQDQRPTQDLGWLKKAPFQLVKTTETCLFYRKKSFDVIPNTP
jgi:hypothetical protein